MRLRTTALAFILLLLPLSASCQNNGGEYDAALLEGQAGAYFAVFNAVYDMEWAEGEWKYIAVDLTGVILSDTSGLLALIGDFCKKHGYTLLEDTWEGLKEKGFLEPIFEDRYSFNDGILISFTDIDLKEDKLVTMGGKSSGPGIGARFTAEKKDGVWEVTYSGIIQS